MRVYELTEVGQGTDALIFALAELGTRFPPETNPLRPGNLRSIALPLRMVLQSVVEEDASLEVELEVDGEPFTVCVAAGRVTVRAGTSADATVRVAMPYEPMLSVMDDRAVRPATRVDDPDRYPCAMKAILAMGQLSESMRFPRTGS